MELKAIKVPTHDIHEFDLFFSFTIFFVFTNYAIILSRLLGLLICITPADSSQRANTATCRPNMSLVHFFLFCYRSAQEQLVLPGQVFIYIHCVWKKKTSVFSGDSFAFRLFQKDVPFAPSNKSNNDVFLVGA